VVPPPPSPPAEGAGAAGGSGGSKKGLLIGIAAALVAVALIVAAVASSDDDDGDTAAAVSSTTTTEQPTTSYTYRTTTSTTAPATTATTAPATTLPTTATTAPTTTTTRRSTATTRSPRTFGDDPQLDALYTGCGQGDMAKCDALYRQAPSGSDYQRFGDTCGDRNDPGSFCVEIYGPTAPGARPANVVTARDNAPGDDPYLDGLYRACDDGNGQACDILAAEAAQGTVYEQYGLTCGRRFASPDGGCAARLA
jgi:hypothetical protein